mmetsp:Transcript_34954/g.96637  ORF Transcript_34954/g.96637 Transcript_34954/m.96637 type:complete len:240 (-) Transcript_34954:171-890(-)
MCRRTASSPLLLPTVGKRRQLGDNSSGKRASCDGPMLWRASPRCRSEPRGGPLACSLDRGALRRTMPSSGAASRKTFGCESLARQTLPDVDKLLAGLDTAEHRDKVQRWRQSLHGHSHKAEFEYSSANPHELLFTNRSMSERFSCGRTVQSTIEDLVSGRVSVQDIPAITVVSRGGRLLSLDHRRLYAFRKALPADARVPVKVIKSEHLLVRRVPPTSECRSAVRVIPWTEGQVSKPLS